MATVILPVESLQQKGLWAPRGSQPFFFVPGGDDEPGYQKQWFGHNCEAAERFEKGEIIGSDESRRDGS
jgi:hypothetical protein